MALLSSAKLGKLPLKSALSRELRQHVLQRRSKYRNIFIRRRSHSMAVATK
jgi:hypothetical protein